MENKFRRKLTGFVLIGLLIAAFALTGRADFGNYAGNSDYSSGGWDSGSDSGWDSGSGWSGSSGSGGYSSGYYGSGAEDSSGIPIIAIVIILIIIIYFIRSTARMNSIHANRPVNVSVRRQSPKGKPIDSYKEIDPDFDSSALASRLSNVYVKLQNAWQDKDISEVRPYLTDSFYTQADRQLDALRRNKQTNYIDRIAVLSVEPMTWYQENDMDHIVCEVRSRIVDYTVDDETGALISGDKNREKFMTYEYDLCRKTGIKTSVDMGLKSVVCPHCGAPLDINQTAKCPYCGSVITIENEDWAIDNIKGIAQQTV